MGIIFTIGGLFWFGLIILMGYYNMKEGDRKASNLKSGNVSVNKKGEVDPSDFSGVAIFAKLSVIDVARFTYVIHFTHFPRGAIIDTTGMLMHF
jgi:hypothetical protein